MTISDSIGMRLSTGTATVIGFGISNKPLVKQLLDMGVKVTVRDAKSPDALGKEYTEYAEKGVKFILGEKYLDGICEDVIFRSPGIRPDSRSIPVAVKNGSLLTSEMEWFLSITPAYVIAVTGSDGKTTTTTLIYKLLEEEYRNTGRKVYVGGNIGTPLLSNAKDMKNDDFAVVELSSFQLQNLTSPINRAVITNITPNHLNWHTDMDEYTNAKLNIYAGNKTELLTVNANDDRTRSAGLSFYADKAFFSAKNVPDECKACNRSKYIFLSNEKICVSENGNVTEVLNINDIKLPGTHNVENYMAAISATWGLVSFDTILKIAKTFGGVEHRLEFVREFNGVKYYNSSIDSSPTRTAAALSALKTKPIVICGGYDKHIPFEPLAEALKEKAKAVVLTGATRFSILDAIDKCPGFDKAKIPVIIEESFEMAVKQASALAKEGDVVLLSPACASFDAFPNFEIRGKTFKNIVNSL
jgi:UDP-N-acetylmuramoylalanine--D-glutamate ligase